MEEVKTAEQTLADTKEIAAKKNGYVSYRNALDVNNAFGVDSLVNKVAELYASQQTASLREEVNDLMSIIHNRQQEKLLAWDQMQEVGKRLEEENKLLREALEDCITTIEDVHRDYNCCTSKGIETIQRYKDTLTQLSTTNGK